MTVMQDPITKHYLGTGRRKTSVARVRLQPGEGKVLINGRTVEDYFSNDSHRNDAYAPLKATETLGSVDITVKVTGGGYTGQAGAVKLGIARALKNYNPEYDSVLRDAGLLTRDSREVERKKYGRRGARRSFQFSKR